MQLDPKHFDQVLEKFLSAWPIERVRAMTLEEYADLSDHDSYCYWLEYGSKYLGAIGNNPLTKFGIWKPKNPKDFDERIKFDGEYAWYRTKGEHREDAFKTVKQAILQVVNFSTRKEWERIEAVDLHKIVKWKIAFLYSEKELLPVYSKRALIAIAKGLGKDFEYSSDTYTLQKFILGSKEAKEHIDVFAHKVYTSFAEKPNFYLIGTKYRDDEGRIIDIFPSMIENKCVAMGYLWEHNLEHLRNSDSTEIDEFVTKNRSSNEPALFKLKRQIKQFLSLKQGDIIAIKSHGRFNQLTIIAYAQVVARDSKIYKYDPGNLGQVTNVEFLETGFNKFLGYTYADTIHQIKPSDERFAFIFGKYGLVNEEEDELYMLPDETVDETLEESIYDKTEDEHQRQGSFSTVVKQIHNKIQNRFVKYLQNNLNGTLNMEYKGRVDIIRKDGDCVWLYEVKPFENPYRCVRESIGQLLDYSHRYKGASDVRIVTVGPSELDYKTRHFISHLKKNLQLPYSYISFDYLKLSVREEY